MSTLTNNLIKEELERFDNFAHNLNFLYGTEPMESREGFEDYKNRMTRSFLSEVIQRSVEAGAKEAYKIFLETIRDSKQKFPGRKEFELVVDVRDVEKSIKHLVDLQSLKK